MGRTITIDPVNLTTNPLDTTTAFGTFETCRDVSLESVIE
jgi:hypothetical protein